MNYVLNHSLQVIGNDDYGFLVAVTDADVFNVSNDAETLFKIFTAFLEPKTCEDAYKTVCKTQFIQETVFQEQFEFMLENNILKEISDEKSELSDYQQEKYSRQIASFSQLKGIEKIDAEKMQEKLCKSSVCIIGIGGVGSHLAMTMAQIGIGKLMLVDFDKIELSNTSRQVLYDESDIGKLKIVVAREKLQKYSPNMQIETHNVKIEKADDLHFLTQSSIDLLVLCADTPRGEITYIVDEAASSLKIPWMLHGPFNHSQIVVGPLFLPGNKTYAELYPHKTKLADSNLATINAHFASAICDPFNAFSSQFASVEILKFLTGYKKTLLINRRYYIDTDTWEIKSVDYNE